MSSRIADGIEVTELSSVSSSPSRWRLRASWKEGIVTDPREADVGSIWPSASPLIRSGGCHYIDGWARRHSSTFCERLGAKYGKEFDVPALLKDMAARAKVSTSVSDPYAGEKPGRIEALPSPCGEGRERRERGGVLRIMVDRRLRLLSDQPHPVSQKPHHVRLARRPSHMGEGW